MTTPSRLCGLLVPLALTCLPACGGGPWLARPDPIPVAQMVAETTPKSKPQTFAIWPSVPGETIPLHPPVAPPATVVVNRNEKDETEIPINSDAVKEKEPTTVVTTTADKDRPEVKAFREYADGRPDAAAEHLKGFDQPKFDLLQQLLPAVVRVAQIDLTQTDTEEAATLARQFETASVKLMRKAGLTVRKSELCLKVDGFGKYTPVRERNGLRGNYPYLLYVEVGNVPCLPVTRSDGVEGFQTRLDATMSVKDELGRAIEIVDEKGVAAPTVTSSKTEVFRSPVHDYFVSAFLWTPSRPGAYTVTLEIRDPKSGTTISRQMPFRVQ